MNIEFVLFGHKFTVCKKTKPGICYPEDKSCLTDVLNSISPIETPFLNGLSRTHSWQEARVVPKHGTKKRLKKKAKKKVIKRKRRVTCK